jgi:predicted transcriptional regulator
MTMAEVAKLTGKSEQSIRHTIKAGKLSICYHEFSID